MTTPKPSRLRFRLKLLLMALVLVVGLTACASQAADEPTPPEIHLGEDACQFCQMIISDERYAAGYLTAAGDEFIFDDIGDMFKHHQQQPAAVTAFFVHDHNEHTWIRAETAVYVLSPDLPTPMLSGLAAFAGEAEASRFAAEAGGDSFTFDELLERYR